MAHEVHPIAAEYPPLPAHDLGRMEQDMRQRGFDPRFPIVLFQGKILDGRHRELAAEAALAENPAAEPVYIQFDGTEEEARWFAMRANEERRHLAAEWLQKRRWERVERVAQRRSEGASLRTIADEEGVTQTQVARDLQSATVTGVTVAPADGKVTGKDGRQQPAKKPPVVRVPEKQTPERDDRQSHPDDAPQEHPEEASQEASPPAAKPGATLRDGEGNPVPERLRDVFADTFLADAIRDLKAWHEAATATPIISGIRKRYKHYPWLPLVESCQRLEAIDRAFELALETLRLALPYAVCENCNGEACDRCSHSGYLPQWKWEARER